MAMGPLTRYPAENERMSATTMRLGSAEEEPVTCGESWEGDGRWRWRWNRRCST